jgi:hypothetical protein
MKKETWKTILQVIVSILTAALTALGKRVGISIFSKKKV